jgi:uncharacterized iron-regulated membrane protein
LTAKARIFAVLLSFQEFLMDIQSTDASQRASFYRTIWRWHFYAGLFVLPFICILSITGAAYLFKPQIDRWEESQYRNLATANMVSPNDQLKAALTANPGAQFHSYRVPERASDAAVIHIATADDLMRDVYVSPDGEMLATIDPETRISPMLARIHGTLLVGKYGSWLVELAASWAIVMILTGLFLWWPSGRSFAGVLWPRLTLGNRAFWRDMHAVTGFWISGLALIWLTTAMPWADVWGNAFKTIRTEMGWTKDAADWKIGSGEHTEHDHAAMLKQQSAGVPMAALTDIVAKAKAETALPYPVLVKPPGAPARFGPPQMIWTVKSEAQNRPLNQTITYDMATGKELSRTGFNEKHPIDRAIGYGIAWHEGQLFGWINQLIGLLTAIGMITLAVSGFVMWRRRKPKGMGAPPLPAVPVKMRGVAAILLLLAAVLPLLAASLILLWLFDRLILPRLPKLSEWLGVSDAQYQTSQG